MTVGPVPDTLQVEPGRKRICRWLQIASTTLALALSLPALVSAAPTLLCESQGVSVQLFDPLTPEAPDAGKPNDSTNCSRLAATSAQFRRPGVDVRLDSRFTQVTPQQLRIAFATDSRLPPPNTVSILGAGSQFSLRTSGATVFSITASGSDGFMPAGTIRVSELPLDREIYSGVVGARQPIVALPLAAGTYRVRIAAQIIGGSLAAGVRQAAFSARVDDLPRNPALGALIRLACVSGGAGAEISLGVPAAGGEVLDSAQGGGCGREARAEVRSGGIDATALARLLVPGGGVALELHQRVRSGVPDLVLSTSSGGHFDFTTPGKPGSVQRVAFVIERSGNIFGFSQMFNRVTGGDPVNLTLNSLRGTAIFALPGGTPFRFQIAASSGTGRLSVRTVQVLP
jgi:hypothetical protein